MDKTFRFDSPLMNFLNRLTDFLFLNIITLICSLPIFTIGAAATALYDALGRMQRDEGGLYKAYFRAFRSNFKQATVLWLIMLGILLLLGISLYIYYTADYIIKILVITLVAAGVIWAMVLSWVFPMQAKFENPVSTTLRNCLLCTIAYLPRSLAMAVLNFFPVFLFYLCAPVMFLLLPLYFSLVGSLILKILKTPYAMIMAPAEEESKEEAPSEV